MLCDDFTEFLDEELGRILPDKQEDYRKLFNSFGLNERNQFFIDFWATYSDEIYGKLGCLVDLAMDLEDFSNSLTMLLRKHDGLPEKYLSFLHGEVDDYLLYNTETDEVYFVEAGHLKSFINSGESSRHWASFESFLKVFLNYHS